MKLSTAVRGLAGAFALALIDQGIRRVNKAVPHFDLHRMNTGVKIMNPRLPVLDRIFPLSLGGGMISNSLYYSLAKGKTYQQTLLRGALLGLGAGIGTLVMPRRTTGAGSTVKATTKEKLFNVAWYVVGGVVAASAIHWFESIEKRSSPVIEV